MIIEETRVLQGKMIILEQIAEQKPSPHVYGFEPMQKKKPRSPKWFKAIKVLLCTPAST